MKIKLKIRLHRASSFRAACACLAAFLTLPAPALPQILAAKSVVVIDASAPVPAPQPVAAKLGSARAPNGDTIGANSQYLTRNGQPWVPVMGEFHFSRYPAAEWEEEILKMKSAGVQVIASYVIWIHHEQDEGKWNWTGQRDLRLFAQLCAKHGMYFYPRIGPWAHAEVRNGGLPDWVLKNGPTRQNDPAYLHEVNSFYQQIGAQLNGLLWKDGGPVIGIQIENEYNRRGAGEGDEHIRTLKQMAVAAGLDVPLYTVTGWDGAAVPLDAVLPVFGGYPDAPWGGSADTLPPNEVYAFRFGNRAAGSMGAIGSSGQNDASSYRGTPFLTAEVGDGIEDTYFRRPVVSPDDVAAMLPVMLGSGANMLGYYMFHGGRNPEGGAITLQESQRTGYPTDVPVKSYDFQAPLGESGQMRESLRKMKLVHYFLNDFGSSLAPMATHAPARVPTDPTDLTVPRVAARTNGDAGFIFFNNHARGAQMPIRKGFQVELKLPSGTVRVPAKAIDLPTDVYGIWPVNLPLSGGQRLRYSTAQLFKKVEKGGETYLFFMELPGVAAEFAFDAQAKFSGPGSPQIEGDLWVMRMPSGRQGEIRMAGGTHLVLLPESQAEDVWRVDDPSMLLTSRGEAYSDGPDWYLESPLNSTDGASFHFGLFGGKGAPTSSVPLSAQPESKAEAALIRDYEAQVAQVRVSAQVKLVHAATARPPWQYGPAISWRPNRLPLAPDDADFNSAAVWEIQLPAVPANSNLIDLFLSVEYQGDVARLYQDTKLIDDNFWNGILWQVGLREVESDWRTHPEQFLLKILPVPKPYPMYIEQAAKLKFARGMTDSATPVVRLLPEYRLTLRQPVSDGAH